MGRRIWGLGAQLALVLLCIGALRADTLTFTNGDQLSGTLVRADAKECIFKSDMAGTVTVPWSHIRELQTTDPYVVVGADAQVRQGTLLIEGPSIEISNANGAPPAFLDHTETRMVVDPKTYTNAVTAHPSPWQSWKGIASGGFSQVSATQNSINYTTRIDLQRPVPALAWLPQRSNTLLHFDSAYGNLSQAGEPTVRTSIYSAGLEQDQDLSARLFVFGNGKLDHNIAQGLELQQAYGGGVGWKLLETRLTNLSLRADLHYTRQRFLSAPGENFLASSFTEDMRHNYGKLVWTQNLGLTPSYTNGPAYQMSGMSSWAVPVYHMLSLNFTVQDSYINNPQPGFLKNSLQVSTGIQLSVH